MISSSIELVCNTKRLGNNIYTHTDEDGILRQVIFRVEHTCKWSAFDVMTGEIVDQDQFRHDLFERIHTLLRGK